jgi:hypothetical protein
MAPRPYNNKRQLPWLIGLQVTRKDLPVLDPCCAVRYTVEEGRALINLGAFRSPKHNKGKSRSLSGMGPCNSIRRRSRDYGPDPEQEQRARIERTRFQVDARFSVGGIGCATV